MTEQRYAELQTRCWQTQQTLDQARQAVERAVQFYDRVPDGDRRRPEAQRRLRHTLNVRNLAESEASRAADELLAYEAQHGPPRPTQHTLPFEHGT